MRVRNSYNVNEYNQAVELIRKSGSIGIAANPNGLDETAAAFAIASFLKKCGKRTSLLNHETLEDGWDKIINYTEKANGADNEESRRADSAGNLIIAVDTKKSPVGEVKYDLKNYELFIIITPKSTPIRQEDIRFLKGEPSYDCVITLGISGPESFGKEFEENPELYYKKPIINIDTSPSNENFGEINLVDIARSSASEIAFEFLSLIKPDARMEKRDATRLLAGIIHKTQSFRNKKTTPRTLEIAALLMEEGADRNFIIETFYKTKPLNLIKLWGRASVRSRYDDKKNILWTFLPKEDFDKTSTKTSDIKFIIEHTHDYFSQPEFHAVLFENPEKGHVRAILKAGDNLLKKIKTVSDSDFKNSFLLFKNSFAGFPEAEKYVDNLISGLKG